MRDGYLRTVLDACVAHGCSVERTARGHVRVRLPGGGQVVTSGTPGDHRAVKNFVGELRRRGVDVRAEAEPQKARSSGDDYKELADLFEKENASLVARLRQTLAERDQTMRRIGGLEHRIVRLEERQARALAMHARLCAAHDRHECHVAILGAIAERLASARIDEVAAIVAEFQSLLARVG